MTRSSAGAGSLPRDALPDTGPLLVPATVTVEVCWPAEEGPDIEAAFPAAAAAGEPEHLPVTAADTMRMAELVRSHADLPPGAVDAPVIALAERLKLTDVATLDRRHFTIVRPQHADALNLLPQVPDAGRPAAQPPRALASPVMPDSPPPTPWISTGTAGITRSRRRPRKRLTRLRSVTYRLGQPGPYPPI